MPQSMTTALTKKNYNVPISDCDIDIKTITILTEALLMYMTWLGCTSFGIILIFDLF